MHQLEATLVALLMPVLHEIRRGSICSKRVLCGHIQVISEHRCLASMHAIAQSATGATLTLESVDWQCSHEADTRKFNTPIIYRHLPIIKRPRLARIAPLAVTKRGPR
jgi:hypothetical protein